MRALHIALFAGSVASLGGCAQTSAPEATPPAMAGTCDKDGLERFTGQTASEALGAEILKVSGARTLRWGPPRSAMTMDLRPDRVTVAYDDAMAIIHATCG